MIIFDPISVSIWCYSCPASQSSLIKIHTPHSYPVADTVEELYTRGGRGAGRSNSDDPLPESEHEVRGLQFDRDQTVSYSSEYPLVAASNAVVCVLVCQLGLCACLWTDYFKNGGLIRCVNELEFGICGEDYLIAQ